jgi:hypothetical protein
MEESECIVYGRSILRKEDRGSGFAENGLAAMRHGHEKVLSFFLGAWLEVELFLSESSLGVVVRT